MPTSVKTLLSEVLEAFYAELGEIHRCQAEIAGKQDDIYEKLHTMNNNLVPIKEMATDWSESRAAIETDQREISVILKRLDNVTETIQVLRARVIDDARRDASEQGAGTYHHGERKR